MQQYKNHKILKVLHVDAMPLIQWKWTILQKMILA